MKGHHLGDIKCTLFSSNQTRTTNTIFELNSYVVVEELGVEMDGETDVDSLRQICRYVVDVDQLGKLLKKA